MAAITGIDKSVIRQNIAWPPRAISVASCAEVQAANMLTSAPAMKELSLPEINTTPLILVSCWISFNNASISPANSALRTFMDSFGTSIDKIAIPESCLVSVKACCVCVIILSPQS